MNKLISLKNNENINILNKINNYNDPEKIYIPAKFLDKKIKKNEIVYKNTYFKDYIVSISGEISGVEKINYGKCLTESLVITNNYKENTLEKNKKVKINNKEELLSVLDKYKLNKIKEKIVGIETIEKLVISSIDEEIYSIKEFIRLSNSYRKILETMDLLINIFNLKKGVLVTKNTNFKSIKNVKSVIGIYPNIKVNLIPDKYLIGHKKFLCDFLNFKESETLVMTTNEIYDIYNILNGKDINETLITISGNAIDKSLIVNTKLGVSLKEILNKFIKYNTDDYNIYINGFMRGYLLNRDEDLIIDKNVDYIVINKKERIDVFECINCGACNKVCPNNINVKRCYEKKLSHKKCLGCGLCNYICPANINLKEIVESE